MGYLESMKGMAGSGGGQPGTGTASGSESASTGEVTGAMGSKEKEEPSSAGMAPIPQEDFSALKSMMATGAAMLRPSKGFESHMTVSSARKGHEVNIIGAGIDYDKSKECR